MTKFNLSVLLKNLIIDLYMHKKIDSVINLSAADAIGFSSHFYQYFFGKNELRLLLQKELAILSPYKLLDCCICNNKNSSNQAFNYNIVLHSKISNTINTYNILIMYKKNNNSFCLTSIHFYKIYTQKYLKFNNEASLPNKSLLFYDDLTGIYNKESFYKNTRILIDNHTDISFEIMCLDIERFKIINELFGIDRANDLLLSISDFFKSAKVAFFVYGRLYADKFILCYPAQNNNRRFFINSLNTLANNFKNNYKVILSFGIYSICNNNLSVNLMCDKAILALKKSKGHYLIPYGEYDNNIYQTLMNEQVIINDMSTGLIHNEFIFYLQPKYDLQQKKIIGAEALVRWYHPLYGHITPDKFIPFLEANGFILELDKYIWEEVCKLLKKWRTENKPLYPVSINISRIDLYDDNLIEFLQRLLKKYQLPAHLLELEITESAYINDTEQIIKITQKLQACGFIILMDDFGSGFSSLNMLKDISVDIIKIDLKFLQDSRHSKRGKIILYSVIQMAQTLNLKIIIEGVETKEQAVFLHSIGCVWIQGYYYSKPLSVYNYEKLLYK